MKPVDDMMRKALSDKVFPGSVLLVSLAGEIVFHGVYGYSDSNQKKPVTKETVFDLASLTKPLATVPAVLKLVELGRLNVSDRLGDLLGAFKGTDKENISVRNLLCHNSGLPAHKNYYERLNQMPVGGREKALKGFLVSEPLEYKTGRSVVYSDIGFMILSWIIEELAKARLDIFVEKEIYRPLGIGDLFFPGVCQSQKRVEGERCFAVTESCPVRKIILEGIVHDDNAYAVGGIQGHAGLFGTSGSVHELLSELLATFNGTSTKNVFRQDLLRLFLEQVDETGRAMGFDMPAREGSSSGKYFSANSVGHLGFTGTSFWMDLERSVIVILLTNRVYPTRENLKIRAFRPVIHDVVMENLLQY